VCDITVVSLYFFFFSSRRRHTRFSRDWSSDVCSSDLVTAPFCGACDRVRLTADGQLRNCLFAQDESDLRTMIREGCEDEEIAAAIRSSLAGKRAGHGIDDPGVLQPRRPMSAIGG